MVANREDAKKVERLKQVCDKTHARSRAASSLLDSPVLEFWVG